MISEIEEITEEQFNDMFNMLPPARWRGVTGYQSFFFAEQYNYNTYRAYMNLNDKYFSCFATSEETHLTLLQAAKQYIETNV